MTMIMHRWTEEQGRAAVRSRSLGRCEGCGAGGDLEWAHRVRRGQGGSWNAANGLDLCHHCHRVIAHGNPQIALGLGWELPPGSDPEMHAAWLRDPCNPSRARWVLLQTFPDADGVRRHVVVEVEPRWVA